MSAESNASRPFAAVSLIAALICIGILSRAATAFNPQPDPPGVGMLGIADGQTIRVNLVNIAATDTAAFAPPCRGRLSIFAADGTELAGRHVNVAAGRATFLDYVASFVPTNTVDGALAPLRAEVLPTISAVGALPPPCRLSVEIFDNATGRTSIALYAPPCRGAACLRP